MSITFANRFKRHFLSRSVKVMILVSSIIKIPCRIELASEPRIVFKKLMIKVFLLHTFMAETAIL